MRPNAQLISEGTPQSTRLITSDGTEVRGITSLQVSITPDGPVAIDVGMLVVKLDVEGLARFRITHPETGEIMTVARIVFGDGSEWSAP